MDHNAIAGKHQVEHAALANKKRTCKTKKPSHEGFLLHILFDPWSIYNAESDYFIFLKLPITPPSILISPSGTSGG